MKQPRAQLQHATQALIAARSSAERVTAQQTLAQAIEVFMGSAVPEAVSGAAMGERTRTVLGGARAPVNDFTEADLQLFNQSLPWAAMTADSHGRVVGAPWSAEKRSAVHSLIDPRHIAFDQVYSLKNKHIAEFGCFEGIHTLSLGLLGAKITGIDGRIENTLKTLARVWAYGGACDVALWDFEQPAPASLTPSWDVLHHVGVLYHLSNPVRHLNEILPRTRDAVLIDTHIANDEAQADLTYVEAGKTYSYRRKPEPHASSAPFAGLADHAKYLLLEDMINIFKSHGFNDVRVPSDRLERNGRRVTVWAFR